MFPHLKYRGLQKMSKSLLLDTHIWLWLLSGDTSLTASLRKPIEEAASHQQLFISAISVWEVAMLQMKGKLKLNLPTAKWVQQALERPEINLLPLSPEIAVESCALPDNFHGDPADRIIVATARLENLVLVTKDEKILKYGKQKFVVFLD